MPPWPCRRWPAPNMDQVALSKAAVQARRVPPPSSPTRELLAASLTIGLHNLHKFVTITPEGKRCAKRPVRCPSPSPAALGAMVLNVGKMKRGGKCLGLRREF
jgi:hypothetical protein